LASRKNVNGVKAHSLLTRRDNFTAKIAPRPIFESGTWPPNNKELKNARAENQCGTIPLVAKVVRQSLRTRKERKDLNHIFLSPAQITETLTLPP